MGTTHLHTYSHDPSKRSKNMSVLSRMNLMTTSDFAKHTRMMLIGFDLNPDEAALRVFKKAEHYTGLVTKANLEAARLQKLANDKNEKGLDDAAALLQGISPDADTAALREEARKLLFAVNLFNKWDWFGLARKALSIVLGFKGISDGTLNEMYDKAEKNKTEATRLETEAKAAYQRAVEANAVAVSKVAEAFKADVAKTEPVLAEAIEWQQLAADLMNTYNTLISSK